MNKFYRVYANGVPNGLCTAPDKETALRDAMRGLTRRTDSKEGGEPDFESIRVEEMAFPVRLFERSLRVGHNVIPLRRAA